MVGKHCKANTLNVERAIPISNHIRTHGATMSVNPQRDSKYFAKFVICKDLQIWCALEAHN
jgi:hypothetical protein